MLLSVLLLLDFTVKDSTVSSVSFSSFTISYDTDSSVTISFVAIKSFNTSSVTVISVTSFFYDVSVISVTILPVMLLSAHLDKTSTINKISILGSSF